MKKITIVGFGNVGKSLIHKISRNFEVNVLTFSKEKKNKEIITRFKDKEYKNSVKKITSDLSILSITDILLITVPNFLREDIIKNLKKNLKKETLILFIPGIGPSQFIANKYLFDYKVACLERVPFIVRAQNEVVDITDDRKIIKYATLKKEENYDELIIKMFEKPVEKVSYFNVTLTSSNAILHTSRMYSIFNDKEGKIFENEISFYHGWDDETSIIFQKCDDEIMRICAKLEELKIITNKIQSLMEYYDSKTPKELTCKIQSINSLKDIKLEMNKLENNRYILKKNIRFLTEDIPYGLMMFKGISEIIEIKTPMIDEIIKWAELLLEKKYTLEKKILIEESTGAPQYYGINSEEDLKNVFLR